MARPRRQRPDPWDHRPPPWWQRLGAALRARFGNRAAGSGDDNLADDAETRITLPSPDFDTGAEALAREAAAVRQQLAAIQASEQRLRAAFSQAAIGSALVDGDGRVLQVNAALCALLGRRDSELLRRPLHGVVLAEDRPLLDALLALDEAAPPLLIEVRCAHADGSAARRLALHAAAFDIGPARRCIVVQALEAPPPPRAGADEAAPPSAFHDPLTGLPNRRRFVECLAGAVARHRIDPGRRWAVLFIDCDRLDAADSDAGSDASAELLRQVARRVQEKLRPGDIVARLDGAEFAVLADHVEHERDAVVLAERLTQALRRPFVVGGADAAISASIGITFSALGYASADEVLRDADGAMFRARRAGHDGQAARLALSDVELHTAVSQRLRLEGELRQAIARGQLAVLYQPVVELGSGRIQGFEALLRWRHPQDGTLEPGAFLPIAEGSGQMPQLSDFVLHCACHQLRRWQLSDPALAGLTMAVNLSAHDLAHPALAARIGRAVVEAGIQPQHLTLELSETTLAAVPDVTRAALAELRRLGVRLAVDDFGTGASNLGQLSRLPVDSLKIDKRFVGQLDLGGADAAVVGAIVGLGATLHKAVVAEGIESAEQLARLRELGCELGQGYHVEPPLTEQAAGQWLRQRRATPLH